MSFVIQKELKVNVNPSIVLNRIIDKIIGGGNDLIVINGEWHVREDKSYGNSRIYEETQLSKYYSDIIDSITNLKNFFYDCDLNSINIKAEKFEKIYINPQELLLLIKDRINNKISTNVNQEYKAKIVQHLIDIDIILGYLVIKNINSIKE